MAATGKTGPRFGCLGYGCGIALVLMIVVCGGVGYYLVQSVRSAVVQYTTDIPPTLPPFSVDQALRDSAREKLLALIQSLEGSSGLSLQLSGDELTAMLQATGWRDFVRIGLSGDQFTSEFAFPLSAVKDWPGADLILGELKERVLAGRAQGRLNFDSGEFRATFSELVLNNKALEDMARGHASQWVTGFLNSANAEGADEVSRKHFARIKSLRIVDGLLALELKEATATSP